MPCSDALQAADDLEDCPIQDCSHPSQSQDWIQLLQDSKFWLRDAIDD